MTDSDSKAPFVKLFGSNLIGKDGSIDTKSLDGKYVGIYFSAHWCPPCRGFTPELAKFYNAFRATEKGKNFEIVFVSSDRDASAFNEYFHEMPWLALPYAERSTKGTLSSKYKVEGIPTLVILDSAGKVVTTEGRGEIDDDPKGEHFPWAQQTLSELLKGSVVDNKGKEYAVDDFKNDVLGLYFGAHWCSPCRVFTPKLVKAYNKLKGEGKNFEIIFASSDEDNEAFTSYFGTMPWKALPFKKDNRKEALSKLFKVQGIPTLVLLNTDRKVISTAGRQIITDMVDEFPWTPKAFGPVNTLCAQLINDQAIFILFPEEKERTAQVALFQPVAEEFVKSFEAEKKKAGDEEASPPLSFFYENGGDLIPKVCQVFSVPKERPALLILNIPKQVKHFHAGPLTKDNTRDFVNDFLANKLTAIPLK